MCSHLLVNGFCGASLMSRGTLSLVAFLKGLYHGRRGDYVLQRVLLQLQAVKRLLTINGACAVHLHFGSLEILQLAHQVVADNNLSLRAVERPGADAQRYTDAVQGYGVSPS